MFCSIPLSLFSPAMEQVCTFLAPLLQKGLVRAHAEAVCDMPGLGVFADVPLVLSIEIEEGVFALDPGAANNSTCLRQDANWLPKLVPFMHRTILAQKYLKEGRERSRMVPSGRAWHPLHC